MLIDKPHAAQSVIHIALVGARRNTADFFPQNVMNMIFGGQFSSRLNMNLREQKGYTYGARSTWDWRVHERGPFVATSSVQTAVTAPALAEFLKELDGMVGARPVEEKELDFCKKYLTRGYTAGFETPSQVAGQLETLFAYKLPDDYFNTVVPGIRAVTAERHDTGGEEVSGPGPHGDRCRRRPGEDRAGTTKTFRWQGFDGLSLRRSLPVDGRDGIRSCRTLTLRQGRSRRVGPASLRAPAHHFVSSCRSWWAGARKLAGPTLACAKATWLRPSSLSCFYSVGNSVHGYHREADEPQSPDGWRSAPWDT